MPRPAFKVIDLNSALGGHTVLLGPYKPIEGFRVAIIEDGKMPIELFQTALAMTNSGIAQRMRVQPEF